MTGRTMREAIDAGDWYELKRADGATLSMPGCRGLRATLRAAVERHWRHLAGTRVRARRVLPGSQIGCMIVEDAGEHELPQPRRK